MRDENSMDLRSIEHIQVDPLSGQASGRIFIAKLVANNQVGPEFNVEFIHHRAEEGWRLSLSTIRHVHTASADYEVTLANGMAFKMHGNYLATPSFVIKISTLSAVIYYRDGTVETFREVGPSPSFDADYIDYKFLPEKYKEAYDSAVKSQPGMMSDLYFVLESIATPLGHQLRFEWKVWHEDRRATYADRALQSYYRLHSIKDDHRTLLMFQENKLHQPDYFELFPGDGVENLKCFLSYEKATRVPDEDKEFKDFYQCDFGSITKTLLKPYDFSGRLKSFSTRFDPALEPLAQTIEYEKDGALKSIKVQFSINESSSEVLSRSDGKVVSCKRSKGAGLKELTTRYSYEKAEESVFTASTDDAGETRVVKYFDASGRQTKEETTVLGVTRIVEQHLKLNDKNGHAEGKTVEFLKEQPLSKVTVLWEMDSDGNLLKLEKDNLVTEYTYCTTLHHLKQESKISKISNDDFWSYMFYPVDELLWAGGADRGLTWAKEKELLLFKEATGFNPRKETYNLPIALTYPGEPYGFDRFVESEVTYRKNRKKAKYISAIHAKFYSYKAMKPKKNVYSESLTSGEVPVIDKVLTVLGPQLEKIYIYQERYAALIEASNPLFKREYEQLLLGQVGAGDIDSLAVKDYLSSLDAKELKQTFIGLLDSDKVGKDEKAGEVGLPKLVEVMIQKLENNSRALDQQASKSPWRWKLKSHARAMTVETIEYSTQEADYGLPSNVKVKSLDMYGALVKSSKVGITTTREFTGSSFKVSNLVKFEDGSQQTTEKQFSSFTGQALTEKKQQHVAPAVKGVIFSNNKLSASSHFGPFIEKMCRLDYGWSNERVVEILQMPQVQKVGLKASKEIIMDLFYIAAVMQGVESLHNDNELRPDKASLEGISSIATLVDTQGLAENIDLIRHVGRTKFTELVRRMDPGVVAQSGFIGVLGGSSMWLAHAISDIASEIKREGWADDYWPRHEISPYLKGREKASNRIVLSDTFGRQIEERMVTEREDGESRVHILSKTKYDEYGRIAEQITFDYLPNGKKKTEHAVTSSYDARGGRTEVRTLHDGSGQLIDTMTDVYSTTSAGLSTLKRGDAVFKREYDPATRTMTEWEEKGFPYLQTQTTYSTEGLVEKVEYFSVTASDKKHLLAHRTIEHDDSGRCIKVAQTGSQDKHYEYDEFDRMTQMVAGDTTVTNTYPDNSPVAVATTATLSTEESMVELGTQQHDGVGRVSAEQPKGHAVTRFSYGDSDMNWGKDSSVTNPESLLHTLDGFSSVLDLSKFTYSETHNSRTSESIYSLQGSLAQFKDIAGNMTEFTYDLHGRVKKMTTVNKAETMFEYDSAGKLLKETVRDLSTKKDMVITFAYDVMGHETNRTFTCNGFDTLSIERTLLSDGRLKKSTLKVKGEEYRSDNYEYQSCGRLGSWYCTGQMAPSMPSSGYCTRQAFTYDALGDVVKWEGDITGHDAVKIKHYVFSDKMPGALTECDNSAAVNDKQGRLIKWHSETGDNAVSYYPNGQVKTISNGNSDHSWELKYDSSGCVRVVLNNLINKTYHYRGEKIYAEHVVGGQGSNYQDRTILLLNDSSSCLLQQVHTKAKADSDAVISTTFELRDAAGSIFASYDLATKKVRYTSYTPYGVGATPANKSWLGFKGEPMTESGGYLLGNGYRLYDPLLHRFTSPDSWSPFGPAGANRYSYCCGDPVNYHDHNGHMIEVWSEKRRLDEPILNGPVNIVAMTLNIASIALAPFTGGGSLGLRIAATAIATAFAGVSTVSMAIAPSSPRLAIALDAFALIGGRAAGGLFARAARSSRLAASKGLIDTATSRSRNLKGLNRIDDAVDVMQGVLLTNNVNDWMLSESSWNESNFPVEYSSSFLTQTATGDRYTPRLLDALPAIPVDQFLIGCPLFQAAIAKAWPNQEKIDVNALIKQYVSAVGTANMQDFSALPAGNRLFNGMTLYGAHYNQPDGMFCHGNSIFVADGHAGIKPSS
ncbi:RHS repeat domain-containing protein [Pseudomonas huaxiensis]|uniref:RHS repeat domain-containing protein n=1 Tax=Pseudomonas huaxiensis TaxID=2213017 RepID=UPI000DA6488A|nr:RHS repeat-associated core domain-containing protein [Pseudomonas huaxiensis]